MANDWVLDYDWTADMDDRITSAYLLGLPMDLVARSIGADLLPRDAQVLIGHRLRRLRLVGLLPQQWQRAYHRSAEMTTTEGYTLMEDVELLQWAANGKIWIDGEIFVEGNRSAEGLRKRCDWLVGLPGLAEKAIRIEREAMLAQWEAESHWIDRDKRCERCDWEWTAAFYKNLRGAR